MTTREAPARSRQRLRIPRSDVAAQLVADIIHQRVETAKRQRAAVVVAAQRRQRRGRLWYFLFALPLLIGLTAWNVARSARAPAVFTADERESAVRLRMYLAAQAVEAYRDSLGRWPVNLAAVGFADVGFVYEAGGGVFEISDTSASVPLTYRRGDALAPFADALQDLRGEVQ
jgi:hypothetical protein